MQVSISGNGNSLKPALIAVLPTIALSKDKLWATISVVLAKNPASLGATSSSDGASSTISSLIPVIFVMIGGISIGGLIYVSNSSSTWKFSSILTP